MDFQQIRDFVNPAVAQATGLQEVDNLQMPVPVAYVPVQIVIDGALSLTSENPVQNKVIAVAIQQLDGRITAIEGQFSEGVTEAVNNWLDAHPEATTTVQDGAITYAKLDANLKGEVDQISDLNSAFQSYNGGTTGQILRKKSNADNDVEWSDVGAPTDEQVQDAVDDYLDAHPEQTTTVVDGSLTEAKFTAQTIVDFKNYVVTPQMYGAKGNGIADDTEAIQTALNAHKKVYFPQGTYKITQPLVLAYGQTIEGDSKYSAAIYAVDCDGIHITNGDAGERGTIRNINVRGNQTAGSKGIQLAQYAPGWSIVDVWVNKFDYGIYGYHVGNVNNIYIDKCIVTGYTGATGGIYIPNSPVDQMNAIAIRDTEINNFVTGIATGGTAIAVTQCTIQTAEIGIEIDSTIGLELGSGYVSTSGCIINNNYFEGITKHAVYCNTAKVNGSTTSSAGFITGLQITNNYIYKAANNEYAIFKFEHSNTYGKGGGQNFGDPTGLEYASVLIGMNYVQKGSNSPTFDMDGCLSRDSIIMHAIGGGIANSNYYDDVAKVGATIISPSLKKKVITRFHGLKMYSNNLVTFVDDKTLTLSPGGVLMFTFNPGIIEFDLPVSTAEYPVYIGYVWAGRKNTDGRLYSIHGSLGFNRDIEDTDYNQTAANASVTDKKLNGASQDGYAHIIYQAMYNGLNLLSWNQMSEMVFIVYAPGGQDVSFTVKSPTVVYPG